VTEFEATPPSPSEPTHTWDSRINGLLFLFTIGSVFWAGHLLMTLSGPVAPEDANWLSGWPFAVPFLLILLFHEFGHWIAARMHSVPASLPYFLPLPFLSPFGSLGAIIVMPERIRSRNALLDVGAAGPLAGMLIAIPTMVIGLSLSEVHPVLPGGYWQEGQSLLYWLIKRLVLGPMPEGYDVHLHPTAFAAWGGFLITMINMLPWGQLDGGHIAYALLGERHHQIARWVRYSLPPLFLYNVWVFVVPVVRGDATMTYAVALSNSAFWLMWFIMTGLMGRFFGAQHPPCEPGELSPRRRLIAVATLGLFVALFMPTPFAQFE
jgi:membrane-associated protease RseP (regulator of RpoE activity)